MKASSTLIFFALLIAGCNSSDRKVDDRTDFNRDSTGLGALSLNAPNNEELINLNQFQNVVENVSYVENADENSRQQLDIIYPESGEEPYKFIVALHGGGWMSGSKNSGSLAPMFQAVYQGYAVAAVNYRTGAEGKWPANVEDAKAAIRYLRTNAEELNLDAGNIVVWGISTGAYLAQMLAATNGDTQLGNSETESQNAESDVQGVVSWYGISDISGVAEKLDAQSNIIMGIDVRKIRNGEVDSEINPTEHVDSNFPPMLMIHGTDDEIAPIEQAENMRDLVNDATGSETAQLIVVNGAGHGDKEIHTDEYIHQTLDFIDEILYPEGNPYRSGQLEKIELLNLQNPETEEE